MTKNKTTTKTLESASEHNANQPRQVCTQHSSCQNKRWSQVVQNTSKPNCEALLALSTDVKQCNYQRLYTQPSKIAKKYTPPYDFFSLCTSLNQTNNYSSHDCLFSSSSVPFHCFSPSKTSYRFPLKLLTAATPATPEADTTVIRLCEMEQRQQWNLGSQKHQPNVGEEMPPADCISQYSHCKHKLTTKSSPTSNKGGSTQTQDLFKFLPHKSIYRFRGPFLLSPVPGQRLSAESPGLNLAPPSPGSPQKIGSCSGFCPIHGQQSSTRGWWPRGHTWEAAALLVRP